MRTCTFLCVDSQPRVSVVIRTAEATVESLVMKGTVACREFVNLDDLSTSDMTYPTVMARGLGWSHWRR
jgi:hypothetical protein